MISLFQFVKTFIGDANELVGLIAVLREIGYAMIDAHTDGKVHGLKQFREYGFDATAEGECLRAIGLREKQGKLISADAECGVGSAQCIAKGGSRRLKNLIAARVAVFVIDFFETMKIESNDAERETIAARTVQFFFESFGKKPAVVETCKRVSNGVELKLFEFVVFDQNGNAEQTGGGKNIRNDGFERNWLMQLSRHFFSAKEDFVPQLNALTFAQLKMSGYAEIALEKLATRRYIQAF